MENQMNSIELVPLITSFFVTWGVGLMPPLALRYLVLKRPLTTSKAIGICGVFWILNFVLFSAIYGWSKSQSVLVLIALFSYWILQAGSGSIERTTTETSETPGFAPIQKAARVEVQRAEFSTIASETESNEPDEKTETILPSHATVMPDERIYADIASEFEFGVTDKGLWTRLFVECDGNENQTKARYIKERAVRLSLLKAKSLESLERERVVHAEIEEKRFREENGIADPALVAAVWNGNWSAANTILQSGIKPLGTDRDGNSLLDLARKRRDSQMTKLLELHGAP